MMDIPNPIGQQAIENRIYTIRDRQVMLDSHFAELSGVETKFLNRAVKRNAVRFPEAFIIQLSGTEWDFLRSHFVTLKN